MFWLSTPANYVKGPNVPAPLSDVYQARYILLAFLNTCLKLGSGLRLLAVSGLVGIRSLNLNKETLIQYIGIGSLVLGFTSFSWHNSSLLLY